MLVVIQHVLILFFELGDLHRHIANYLVFQTPYLVKPVNLNVTPVETESVTLESRINFFRVKQLATKFTCSFAVGKNEFVVRPIQPTELGLTEEVIFV